MKTCKYWDCGWCYVAESFRDGCVGFNVCSLYKPLGGKMKLIKDLGTKRMSSGWIKRFGLFECPRCSDKVEKLMHNGKRNKDCGCLKRERKHPLCKSPLYMAWSGMKSRCLNPKYHAYPRYGGRGIRVCRQWLEFSPFCDWALNNGYASGLELDRIDNDGDYRPDNCHWTDCQTNVRNSSATKLNKNSVSVIKRLLNYPELSQIKIAQMYSVTPSTISHINRGFIWKDVKPVEEVGYGTQI